MRIGILGTLSKPIVKNSTGGTETFCRLLAMGLVEKGHEVLLFASDDAFLPGVKTISASAVTMQEIRENMKQTNEKELSGEEKTAIDHALVARLLVSAKIYEQKVDLFHDNTSSLLVGSTSDLFTIPIVTTLHMPPSSFSEYISIPQKILTPRNHFVAVSRYEKQQLVSTIPSVTCIYNGIDVGSYTYSAQGGEPLIWIGRISSKTPKGLPEAMDIVKRSGHRLFFSGIISDQAYYDSEVVPKLYPGIVTQHSIRSQEEKNEFYGKAKAALFPIQWEEPFGFVFIEAMACGTPLIAYARGAVPEIIVDGVTGYIVNSSDTDIRGNYIVKKTGEAGMLEAIERMYALSQEDYQTMRQACRSRVERMFTATQMVDQYISLYQQMLAKK